MPRGELRALAMAMALAGCAFGDAGQSTGGPTPTTGAAAGGGSASAGAAGPGGGGGFGGAGGASSVSSATGGTAGAGIGGGGGAGGAVPCANSADCGGMTCCQTFEGARPVFNCVPTPPDCDPRIGGTIQCGDASECLNIDDECCSEGFCAGNSGCPGG